MARKKARTSQASPDRVDEIHVSASQSVLANDDLLHHIFLWLDKSDLASAIRVSKTFFDPGVRWLWSTLLNGQISALLNLLPPDVLHDQTRDPHTDIVVTKRGRSIVKSDLDRWSLYVPYLRSLTFHWTFTPAPSVLLTLPVLVTIVPRNILFPNLKELFGFYSPTNLELLKVLLSPSLQQVQLHGAPNPQPQSHYIPNPLPLSEPHATASIPFHLPNSSTHDIITLLDFLPAHAPNLTELQITGLFSRDRAGPSCAAALAACIKQLPKLQTVLLDNIARSSTVFSSIMSLKDLKDLHIEPTSDATASLEPEEDMDHGEKSSTDFWEDRIPKTATKDVFCHLKDLNFVLNHSPQFVAGMLEHLRPPLGALHVRPLFSEHDVASLLLTSIVEFCPDLTALTIVVRGCVPSDLWTSLDSLRQLRLQELALVVADCESISTPNERLINLARMHPGLRKFVFDINQTAAGAAEEPTFSALLSLADECPDLEELQIGPLFSSGDVCTTIPIKKPALKELQIHHPTYPHVGPVHLAEFICLIWPNASVVGMDPEESKQINTILDSIRRTRQVEAGKSYLGL